MQMQRAGYVLWRALVDYLFLGSGGSTLIFQNSAKNFFVVCVASIMVCSTLIVGVNWNSLVTPQRLSSESGSCADNGYLLSKFFNEIHFFPPPGSILPPRYLWLVYPRNRWWRGLMFSTVLQCTLCSSIYSSDPTTLSMVASHNIVFFSSPMYPLAEYIGGLENIMLWDATVLRAMLPIVINGVHWRTQGTLEN